jgi:Rrf2 family protein
MNSAFAKSAAYENIMKISTRVECGIIALIDIAINSEDGTAISTVGISERQNISAKYLEQILIALKQANLIRGQKGSRGGYTLSKPAATITFDEIINALDVTILCDTYVDDNKDSSDYRSTINDCIWSKLTDYMQDFTSKITLADVAEKCRSNDGGNEYMYYI